MKSENGFSSAMASPFVDDPRFAEQEAESQVCARRISAGAKFFRIKQ